MGGNIPSRLVTSHGATRGTKASQSPYRVASSKLAHKGHAPNLDASFSGYGDAAE
jgi:hypothetical protein